jgi:hypothetical protein
MELLTALVAEGRVTRARQIHDAYARAVRAATPEDPNQLVLSSELALQFRLGNVKAAQELAARAPRPIFSDLDRIPIHLELGELREAEALLRRVPSPVGAHYDLFFSIAWAQKGDVAKAKQYYDSAVGKFKDGTPENRAVASLLGRKDGPTIEELHRVQLSRSEALNVLVALAGRFPDRHKLYLKQAARLNLPGPFPYRFLNRSIDRIEP